MAAKNDSPFVFGIMVEGDTFTDRKEETRHLKMNFLYGVNTILISPRRMGKTSLVEKASELVKSDTLKIVKMDAFGCRSENDFINSFATAVIRATSMKLEEWIENAKKFLGRFVPKISIGQDPLTDFSVSLEYSQDNSAAEDILQLPEFIAQNKGIRIVICIDEFQQVADFPDSLTFQKKLRGVWQRQQNVSYCLYGSKRHMMELMFQSQSHPFYRFGDIFYLGKIPETDWVAFICERFRITGKEISEEIAKKICTVTDRYSSYVQQLSWLVWLRSGSNATEDNLDNAIDSLLDACEPLFIQQTESLSAYQMNFLHVLADGIHSGFTRSELLEKYRLGTAANISRLRKALTEKDLIAMTAPKNLEISDPILTLWLKRRVWKNN